MRNLKKDAKLPAMGNFPPQNLLPVLHTKDVTNISNFIADRMMENGVRPWY